MQPLSNFQFPTGHCEFGRFETMISHPQIAVRVAACISEWAEIETTLGVLLAILLNASPKAALAMYGSTENRTTQIKMVMAAAVHQLSQDESDLLDAIFAEYVRPAAKDRDKLAHWCWGVSLDFPDGLLLTAPTTKTALYHYAIDAPSKPEMDAKEIFLVREKDLERMGNRFQSTRNRLLTMMSLVREKNPQQRAALFQQLSSEPRTVSALARIRANRQNPPAPPPPPPAEQSATP